MPPSHKSQLKSNHNGALHYNTMCAIISLFVCAVTGHHGAVVHWSRWRSLVILIMATVLTSACADLVTENIQPILNQPNISQVKEESEHVQEAFIWLFFFRQR